MLIFFPTPSAYVGLLNQLSIPFKNRIMVCFLLVKEQSEDLGVGADSVIYKLKKLEKGS